MTNWSQLRITTCPTCGSGRIRRVKRDITTKRGGKTCIARGIVVEECPDCGERLFGPEALRRIEEQRATVPKQAQASSTA